MEGSPIRFGAPPRRFGALLAEGEGRLGGSRKEFARYVVMALSSADESKLWCQYAEDLGYVAPGQAQEWRVAFSQVARMLHGLLARYRQERLSPDN